MKDAWTYEGYWNVVLGARCSAAQVTAEYQLVADELDEWLGHAEAVACAFGGLGGCLPAEWSDFHARALADLRAAL